jgi:hypothetical protein
MKTTWILAALSMVLPALAQDEGKPLQFETPKEWVKGTPSSKMRKAQYGVPDKEKKAKDAEFAVFHFGKGAGSVEDNIKRWGGQMGVEKPKSEAIEGKCKVTLVDITGTYTERPGSAPIENARMLAAVVETPDGPWFLKLTGVADTVGDWREEFVKLLKEAHP